MTADRFAYPAIFARDKAAGGYVVTFPDIPEAVTQGDDLDEALAMAEDAASTALEFYIKERRPLPRPSRARKGQRMVSLPPLVIAKLAMYETMLERNLTPAGLASLLDCNERHVSRLLNLHHQSRLDHMESALIALGKRLAIHILDAA